MAQLDVSRSDVEERSDAPTRGWPLRPTYPANAPERAVMPRLTAPRLFRKHAAMRDSSPAQPLP